MHVLHVNVFVFPLDKINSSLPVLSNYSVVRVNYCDIYSNDTKD